MLSSMFSSILQKPIVVTIDSYRFTLLQCKKGRYNFHIDSHFHGEHYYELNYILSGNGTLVSNDTSYPISPMTYFLHGPHIVHSQHPNQGDYIEDYCLTMTVHKRSSRNSSNKSQIGDMFNHMNFFCGKDNGELLYILQQINQEIEEPSIGHDFYLQGLFQQFIIFMIRYFNIDSSITKAMIHMDLNEYRHIIIQKAFMTISDCSTLTLEKLAEQIQCSQRQTQRILQQNYGKSFRELKTYYTMQHAVHYLNSSMSIKDISMLLNYSSTEQFNRSFKNYYHVTPKQYRLSHKNTPYN